LLVRSFILFLQATGVYIGGKKQSRATFTKCDIINNGKGSDIGVSRGHSGVYVERGAAKIIDCNVSHNTLTGVSVVARNEAKGEVSIELSNSDVCGNEADQLELSANSWQEQGNNVHHNAKLNVPGNRTVFVPARAAVEA
jgi:hypothetical protein